MHKSIRYFIIYTLIFTSCSHDINSKFCLNFDHSPCIMIVPDIQNYTSKEENFIYLDAISNYYINNRNRISVCLQVGDLTNNNLIWQYENAYCHFFSKFNEEDELIYCLGNHDYGYNGSSESRISNIPSYMDPLYDERMENCIYDNYVKYVNIGDVRYGILVLEFATRNRAIEWADKIISNNPDTPYIILTHAFLNRLGEMYDYTDPNILQGGSHKMYIMDNDYKNDSKEIFDKIIYNNPNVKLVICGHCLTPNYIDVYSTKNAIGNAVHFIMVNYQHYNNGGDSLAALLYFGGNSYRIRSIFTNHCRYGNVDIVIDK